MTIAGAILVIFISISYIYLVVALVGTAAGWWDPLGLIRRDDE